MNELLVPETLTPLELYAPGGVERLLQQIAKDARATLTDPSTDAGRKEIASLAYKIARSKTLLDDMGKELVTEWKEKAGKVDAERRKVRDTLDALKDEIRKPLTDFEEAEKQRVAGHEQKLADLEAFVALPLTEVSAIQTRLDEIPNLMQRDWQEFSSRATETADRVRANLQKQLSERQKYEADQAELERLRVAEAARQQKEREDKLKAEAADNARRQAEEKAAAEARAIAEKAAAERKAIEQQKQNAEDRERKAIADKRAAEERAAREKEEAVAAERKRADAHAQAETEAAEKRETDVKHKSKINNAALNALVSAGLSVEDAKLAVEAIAKRQIPNVSISY